MSYIKTYCDDIARIIQWFKKDYHVFRDFYNVVSICILQIGELAKSPVDSNG